MADETTSADLTGETAQAAEPSRFVVAEHPEVGRAVVARSALDILGEGGWVEVEDVDDPSVPLGDVPPAEPAPLPEGGAFDPSAHTVPEVLAHLEQVDETERQRVLAAETSGKSRTTILDGHQEA